MVIMQVTNGFYIYDNGKLIYPDFINTIGNNIPTALKLNDNNKVLGTFFKDLDTNIQYGFIYDINTDKINILNNQVRPYYGGRFADFNNNDEVLLKFDDSTVGILKDNKLNVIRLLNIYNGLNNQTCNHLAFNSTGTIIGDNWKYSNNFLTTLGGPTPNFGIFAINDAGWAICNYSQGDTMHSCIWGVAELAPNQYVYNAFINNSNTIAFAATVLEGYWMVEKLFVWKNFKPVFSSRDFGVSIFSLNDKDEMITGYYDRNGNIYESYMIVPMKYFKTSIPPGGINSTSFTFQVVGDAGTKVIVQSSTNLLDWRTLQVVTLSDKPISFTDTNKQNTVKKYFKAFPE